MPNFYVEDVDIDIDEFVSKCSNSEIEDLIDSLIDSGYLPRSARNNFSLKEPISISESFYEDALDKLHGKWNMLSQEEEQLILNIAKRF
jgi:hypothetical protein